MYFDDKNFRLVVIDYPIYTLNDPFCATLLGRALSIKHSSYLSTYSEHVLPFDKADFFGTHIILCEEKENEFLPLIIYKSTPLDRCQFHHFEFPALSVVKTDAHPSCGKDIQKIIDEVDAPPLISYDSSLAINLDYRHSGKEDIKILFREIITMAIVKHHLDSNIPHVFGFGIFQVNTPKLFKEMGFKELNSHAQFHLSTMDNQEILFLYADCFTLKAHQLAKKHQRLWEEKLVIDGMQMRRRIKIAA